MLYVAYNSAMDKLSARWIEYPALNWSARWIYDFIPGDFVLLSQSLVCGWLQRSMLLFYNAATDTSIVTAYQRHLREDPNDGHSPVPFGDREVVGFHSFRGTHLWFFNPEFDPSVNIDDWEYFAKAKERTPSPHFVVKGEFCLHYSSEYCQTFV